MMKPTPELIRAARKELKRRAAGQNLAHFLTYTTPGYLMGWVHKEICAKLDRFLADVAAKKSPRLIICMPPRSGKSEIVSRAFPAYAFGRNPDLQIMAASYSADLAERFSRDVQNRIESDVYAEVFPDTRLAGKGDGNYFKTKELFEIVGHKGSYKAAGVGGGITGMGADIFIIDDPLKDRKDANSETMRQALWDWYTSTAYTRISPGGGAIVMCTRWHLDDLVGRLIEKDRGGNGDHWEVINYPAIAEEDEPHRKKGEALHPERFPIEALQRIKTAVGATDWLALYQQTPVPSTGAVFQSDWLQYWSDATLPKHFDATCFSWDMTFKGTTSSDYVVGQVWGRKGASFYLLDQFRGQWSFVKTLEVVAQAAEKWPNVMKKLVEEKANGAAIIDALKNAVPGLVPINPTESKEARASAVTPLWEAKNVYLPPPERFQWVSDCLIPELMSFPAGAHDDQVDAMTQALTDLHKRGIKIDPTNRALLMRERFRR